jgi:hypothetical protein
MSGNPWPARIARKTIKPITFDGTADNGAIGTVALATVAGSVWIQSMAVECTTLLAGATATIELGTANNTTGLIALTTATDIDADEYWKDASPEAEISDAIVNKLVNASLIYTIRTAGIDSGVLVASFYWLPMDSTGKLS